MSEAGWHNFVSADGVDDWVILHGGAVAAFPVSSLTEGTRLAEAVARVPGFAQAGALLTVSDDRLTVRLTRDIWQLERHHIEVAKAVSATLRTLGATADRSAVQEVQLAIAAKPDEVDLPFWRAVLGYDAMADDNGVDPLGHGSTVWMQQLDDGKPLRHAMHVDVSVARECVHSRLDAALAAGGRIVHSLTDPASWVLSDRAGNRVCLCAWPDGPIEPDVDR